jgi:hypothetical protein
LTDRVRLGWLTGQAHTDAQQAVGHFAYPYRVVSDKAYRHLSKAGYKTAFQLKSKRVDPAAALFTLRRSLAVSTWSGGHSAPVADKPLP